MTDVLAKNVESLQVQQGRQGNDISDLKSGHARLEVGLNNLENTMLTGFGDIKDAFSENQGNKASWVHIAGLIVSILVVFSGILAGGFGIITSSMQRENDLRFQYVEKELERKDNRIIKLEVDLTTTRVLLGNTTP